ncbi:MAG: multifunctional CCA tRNA nucleotidyl transferase/2'3'-cyclic phosphodiesterase/2'nucleotidase/phosphatase [Gammaproteobacteria bacterium]|nr:multifunctional CCA tRNA nucleotidyl transferase/2'3'-cyclic phosphodiesterase/2'nucleotidase/phosphatase [Gammaproteobacteria bacterium]
MEVYRVGGSVRDELLGLPVRERDWVVVGATRDDMLARGFKPVGRHFPVFIHPESGEEYALARTERKTGHGYHGFAFDAEPGVTLEQDLSRRDLTVNAMARTADGQLVDPHGGRGDIKARTLRHVSPAFAEDPVRILRAARFAAKLHDAGFTVADATMTLMQAMVQSGEADHLVAERVWQETEKALATAHPSVFFDVMKRTGALARVLPEMEAAANDTDAMRALDEAAAARHPPEILLALLACFALPSVSQQSLQQPPPSALQQSPLVSLCERLKLPNRYRWLVSATGRFLEPLGRADALSREELLDLLEGADALRKGKRFEALLTVCALARGAAPAGAGRVRRALRALAAIDFGAALAGSDDGAGNAGDVKQRVRELKLDALKATGR